MKKRNCMIFVGLVLSAILFHCVAEAETYKLFFNVVTTNYTTAANREVNADIVLGDTMYRAPDAIKSLVVTAPGGKVFTYDPTDPAASKNLYWDETIDEFWFRATASDFGGTIPSGNYSVKVIDKSNLALSSVAKMAGFTLACPTVTSPTAGSTVSSVTPKITWTKVAGAKLYKVFLRYGSGAMYPQNYPIYPYGLPGKDLRVYRNWVTIPKGVLFPGTNYMLRIEARNSDTNYTQRARSNWVSFNTP